MKIVNTRSVVCFAGLAFCLNHALAAETPKKDRNPDVLLSELSKEPKKEGAPASPWTGSVGLRAAYAYGEPSHLSSLVLRGEVSRKVHFGDAKGKLSVRCEYDAAYRSDFYSNEVRKDQRSDCMFRETYLDFSASDNWDFRLGRQNVVWGEVPGMAIADVVSAWDTRLAPIPYPSLVSDMRIPQWAAVAERSIGDVHASFLFIPYATVNRIGKHGSDFYPSSVSFPATFLEEERPDRSFDGVNYGMRLSKLVSGWDASAFYYRSTDVMPTFARVSPLGAPPIFQPKHDRIHQLGGTLSKDISDNAIFKAEGVYTQGRRFLSLNPFAASGLVPQKTFDYAVGADFTLPKETRLSAYFFQRVFIDHDPSTAMREVESGASVFLQKNLGNNVEAEMLFVYSFNGGSVFRPQVSWKFEKNWRLAGGVEMYNGKPSGLLGRFDKQDRVFTEVRYMF